MEASAGLSSELSLDMCNYDKHLAASALLSGLGFRAEGEVC